MLTRWAGGDVTNSQLFNFNGGAGPLAFQPQNDAGSCLVVKGNALDIAKCNTGDAGQSFTFGGAAAGGGNNTGGNNTGGNNTGGNNTGGSNTGGSNTGGSNTGGSNTGGSNTGGNNTGGASSTTTCTKSTRTVTVPPTKAATAAPSQNEGNGAVKASTASAAQKTTSTSAAGGAGGGATKTGAGAGDIPSVNPTDPVPVSRAGGTLQPTAAAQSHQRDETAKRAFSSVSIRAPNGQCLFIDPTAGDFRENLIPVSLVDCTGSPNEKWDLITEGKHNKPNPSRPATLVVSALVRAS